MKQDAAELASFPKCLYLIFDVVCIAIAIQCWLEGELSSLQGIMIVLLTAFYACVLTNLVLSVKQLIHSIGKCKHRVCKTTIGIIVLSAFLSFVFNFECINAWPQYDSYGFALRLTAKDITSIVQPDGLLIGGHITDSYTLLGVLIREIVPQSTLGPLYPSLNSLYILNMLTMFFGMILVYKTLRFIVQGHSETFYFISTLLFGVSPLLLGSSYMLFPDKLLLFGTILFVYSFFTEDDALHLIALFIICTTKETGFVMVFACSLFEVALTTATCIKQKRVDDTNRIRIVYYMLALIIGVILFARYFNSSWFNGDVASAWSGVQSLDGKQWNSIAISGVQFLCVLKASFLTNFTWLLAAPIVIGIMIAFFSRKASFQRIGFDLKRAKPCFYLLVMGASYLFAVSLFITGVRWRYFMPSIYAVYVLAICAFDYLAAGLKKRELILSAVSSVITVLLFAQSYFTIDPVMLSSFTSFSTGQSRMVSLDQNCDFYNPATLSPSSEYNRQVGTFAKALDKALETAIDPAEKQLFTFSSEHAISQFGGALVSIWGQGYEYIDPPYWAHWDDSLKQRYLLNQEQGSINTLSIDSLEDANTYRNQFDDVFYISMPWGDSVLEEESVRQVGEIEYLGWRLATYCLDQ